MNARSAARQRRLRKLVHDHRASARTMGLKHVDDQRPGITRVRSGKGFSYRYQGSRVTDRAELMRIRALAIPPAWTQVWICPDPAGHLQATGRDAKGRKQYRYHAAWAAVRGETKFVHALDLGRRLPEIRAVLAEHLALPGLPKEKVLAAVVSIMDRTHIRVGQGTYAKTNGSYGLSTLQDRHVKGPRDAVRFVFRGKAGVLHDIPLRSARLSRLVMRCKELPGQELFQYVDEEGTPHPIDSGMVNDYIRSISGDRFTSKDLRTWMGTVHCLHALVDLGDAEAVTHSRSNINQALDQVAERLGNTRAVCRKYYVHPQVIALYERHELFRYTARVGEANGDTSWAEHAVLRVLAATAA